MTFHGRYRGGDMDPHEMHHDEEHDEPLRGVADTGHDQTHQHHLPKLEEVHESPKVMLVPLGLLALGALFAGLAFNHYFLGEGAHEFWRASIFLGEGHEGHLPLWVEFAPLAVTIIGFLIAFYYYILHPELPKKLADRKDMLYLFLYNKWYFDELYDFLFVRPAFALGRFLWKRGDGTVIDGLGPDGIAARVLDASRGAVKLQTGYVYHYALAMLLGVVALATWFMISGGAL
jgi:NADH-quinone oxidoreductase subunit L